MTLVWCNLVLLYGISSIVGYLKLNPLYTYILDVNDLVRVFSHDISTIVGYLIPNPVYEYILNL